MKKKPLCVKTLAHGTSAENGEPNWISAIATVTNADIVASGEFNSIFILFYLSIKTLVGSTLLWHIRWRW